MLLAYPYAIPSSRVYCLWYSRQDCPQCLDFAAVQPFSPWGREDYLIRKQAGDLEKGNLLEMGHPVVCDPLVLL